MSEYLETHPGWSWAWDDEEPISAIQIYGDGGTIAMLRYDNPEEREMQAEFASFVCRLVRATDIDTVLKTLESPATETAHPEEQDTTDPDKPPSPASPSAQNT